MHTGADADAVRTRTDAVGDVQANTRAAGVRVGVLLYMGGGCYVLCGFGVADAACRR